MTNLITGRTKIFGIIGYPVKHSFSPIMHNAAFNELKMDAKYLPFAVKPENISQAIDGIKAMAISGINVTIPHKSSIIPFLDEITPLASKIGAVNTVKNVKGRLIGTNTDVIGFIRSLKSLNFSPQKKKIGLLGAGGSARALLAGLADVGASEILIHNRTTERAEKLEIEFSKKFLKTKIKSVSLERIQKSHLDLLVNTTTVGMESDVSPIDLSQHQNKEHVVDIIYSPSQTRLIKQAKKLSIPNINGLGMLLYQGCEAFKFWTGRNAPEIVMQEHLLNLVN